MSDPALPAPQAQGTLDKRPLAHLLAYVYERRLSGSLIFGDASAPVGVIVIRAGEPIKAHTDQHGDVWDALADLPAATEFGYYADVDALPDDAGGAQAPLAAVLRVLQRRPPTALVQAMLARLAGSPMMLEPTLSVASLGLGKAARDALELLRVRPFTMDDVRDAPALRGQADLVVYGLLITKSARIAAGSSPNLEAPRASSHDLAPAPSSSPEVPVPDSSEPAAVGRVRLTRSSQKMTQLKEETVVSSYDERASLPPPKPAPSVPDFGARRQEILARAATIDKMNYFEMLGIAADTPTSQVQPVFLALAKRWHPDRVGPELADVREACARVFARLSEAASTLGNEEQRAKYMRLLDEGGATPEDQEKIGAVLDAASAFQKAEVMLKRGDLAKAEEFCATAVRLDAQPDYTALLGWLESQKPENQSPEATQRYEAVMTEAIAKSERCERAVFYRGLLRKRRGDVGAIEDFRRAFELNPKNLDAQREVRVFDMRSQKEREKAAAAVGPDKRPSFVGRLFKK